MIIQKLSYLKVSQQSESTCSTIFVTARLCSYHFKNDLPRHFVLMLCTLVDAFISNYQLKQQHFLTKHLCWFLMK